ncbi:caspase family protein, partial [Streptomyces cyaneofuscatus]
MTNATYALLVGIDTYGEGLSPLKGCVADIREFEAFLRGRVADDRLHLRTLLDGEATRQAVVDGFLHHLARAGAQDVAVFCFAGHGSREPVEERFRHLEPTGWNQTLVCADSRTPGVRDLADKEINELIRRVAARGAHVLTVLDSCHSGGATRGM